MLTLVVPFLKSLNVSELRLDLVIPLGSTAGMLRADSRLRDLVS